MSPGQQDPFHWTVSNFISYHQFECNEHIYKLNIKITLDDNAFIETKETSEKGMT